MSISERALRRAAGSWVLAVVATLWLAACAMVGEPEVVAGSATTVTFRWVGNSPPDEAAVGYCAKHGRKAVYQGGVDVGPGGSNLYAYDCVETPPQ